MAKNKRSFGHRVNYNIRCPKCHSLMEIGKGKDFFKNGDGEWVCDGCGREFSGSHSTYHCDKTHHHNSKSSYDLCKLQCARNACDKIIENSLPQLNTYLNKLKKKERESTIIEKENEKEKEKKNSRQQEDTNGGSDNRSDNSSDNENRQQEKANEGKNMKAKSGDSEKDEGSDSNVSNSGGGAQKRTFDGDNNETTGHPPKKKQRKNKAQQG